MISSPGAFNLPPLWKQACAGILLCLGVLLALEWNAIGKNTDLQRDILHSIMNSYNAYGQAEMPLTIGTRDLHDCRGLLIALLVKQFNIRLANDPEASHQSFTEWCSREGQLEILISKKQGK